MVVMKQKYVNPPKSENERGRQEMKFDWKGSFIALCLNGKILNARSFI